jgi:hypothetical protein
MTTINAWISEQEVAVSIYTYIYDLPHYKRGTVVTYVAIPLSDPRDRKELFRSSSLLYSSLSFYVSILSPFSSTFCLYNVLIFLFKLLFLFYLLSILVLFVFLLLPFLILLFLVSSCFLFSFLFSVLGCRAVGYITMRSAARLYSVR